MAMTVIEMNNSSMKMDVDVDDDDDDLDLCFRSKRKSTANVVRDEYVPGGGRGRQKKKYRKYKKEERKALEELDAWLEECDKLPRLYSDEEGDVDFSDAAIAEVDGPSLKKIDEFVFYAIVFFAHKCRKKACLQLFRHPGDPRMGGLGSVTGRCLHDEDRNLAVIAIKLYQELNQNVKLQLRDLMKLNHGIGDGSYYLTFSAEDERTGVIKTYQAALKEHFDGHLLGLFRDIVTDKTLAILSVKGTDEDLVADEDEYWRMCEEGQAEEQAKEQQLVRLRRLKRGQKKKKELQLMSVRCLKRMLKKKNSANLC